MTKNTFDEMMVKDNYYKDRWDYFKEIIIELENLKVCFNILEIGPYKLPIVDGEDVIDVNDFQKFYPMKINKFIKHDCANVPYPIKDKKI